MDAVLDSLDDDTKRAAFEDNFIKLCTAPRLDPQIVRVCVQLLSEPISNSRATSTVLTHERLWNLVESHICSAGQEPEYLHTLADVCLSRAFFAAYLSQRVYKTLDDCLNDLSTNVLVDGEEQHVTKAVPYLRFLMCSFWLPRNRCHLITPKSIALLSSFIGIHSMDDAAHDTISALLSLSKDGGPLTTAEPGLWPEDKTQSRQVQPKNILEYSLWTRLKAIEPEHFTSSTSKVFRTWFQWISLVVANNIEVTCIYDDQYWDRLRLGLLNGFADQRKYCLGILRQSLFAADKDITTPTMRYDFSDRALYLAGYQAFANIFETVVLNRYAKQVEACLPELLNLLGPLSVITPIMATTFLRAVLNSQVQEGVRKMIGNWYMRNVINNQLSSMNVVHVDFLLEGLLPWAVDGGLFTSTLISTRETTECIHGTTVVDLIIKFMSKTLHADTSITLKNSTEPDFVVRNSLRRALSLGIIRFISNAEGRIFQPAILYLLEGLVKSLRACPEQMPLQNCLRPSEIVDIIGLSRLTGLPKIMSDLFSLYCAQLCEMTRSDWKSITLPGCAALQARIQKLEIPVDQSETPRILEHGNDPAAWLQGFLKQLRESKHKSIQGSPYAPACRDLVNTLDNLEPASINQNDLYDVLDAVWQEAERREFIRPVSVHLPPLLFHRTCIQVCILQHNNLNADSEKSLDTLLAMAMECLQRLSVGRLYLVSTLAKSIREAVFTDVSIVSILPIEDYIVEFINNPPSIISEFLFEVATAERLEQILPSRTFASYYGQREWHAYAAIIDLLQRFPEEGIDACKCILDRLLEPWKVQCAPIPIKSPWKQTLQLQAMLILSDFAIAEADIDTYLDTFAHVLVLEPWPRYRYLLEWIIARMYRRSPDGASRILKDFENLETFTPIYIASLMKLGTLVAPFYSENFTVDLATQLTCLCTSPKVHIRHEANFTLPLLFDLAEQKGWKGIIENPILKGLNNFIRRLGKFNATPWTIRTLRLDVEKDFTIVNIFEGSYLSIESPEPERVTHEDFVALTEGGTTILPPGRIPLGDPQTIQTISQNPITAPQTLSITYPPLEPTQTFLQTKAGFDLPSLHPPTGPPSAQSYRPTSVILVASLIDNPTNLGGLSRISESFGLEALYIADIKKTAHKDFKATSVTSEKHFPIRELREPDVPRFLVEAKTKGYQVVGIEQTDRSMVLGEGRGAKEARGESSGKGGVLLRKCVLVLGSEKEGISTEVLAVVDRCVEIRTVGVTRSLNVQTAGGIALYEWWRIWGGKSG